MEIANIVPIYRDIVPANYVRVREPYGENGALGTLTSVKRLMDAPLAEAHVSAIFVAPNASDGKSVRVVKSDDGHKVYGVVGRIREVADTYESVRYILPSKAWVFVPFKDQDDLIDAYTRKECLNKAVEMGYINT